MNQKDAYNLIIHEYLDKLKHPDYGCDSCIVQTYCIYNDLRTDRYPQSDCPKKLKEGLRRR